MTKKITIKEFWESGEPLAIHCENLEQAVKFCEEAYKLGYDDWHDDETCLHDTGWDDYENETCYDNTGDHGNIEWYKERGYKVYKFDEIDFMEYFKTPKELYDKWGKDLQLNMVIEEMSELTKEILKDKRGKGIRENIVEELADVLFTLEYVKIAFNISDNEIKKVLEKKGLEYDSK